MSQATILVVEESQTLRESICDLLEQSGHATVAVVDGQAARQVLRRTEIDLVLAEQRGSLMDGVELANRIGLSQPGLPVLLMAEQVDGLAGGRGLRHALCEFIAKPFDPESLLQKVQAILDQPQLLQHRVVANDLRTRELLELAGRVAMSNATVSIGGESGTGKEVFARYIHRQSPRRDGPFVAINCAAIPDNMLEAMLFGYEKGAYTGAYNSAPGKFEQAQGGTLLLDEVSEMSLALQAKLLRVLQEKEVERLGGRKIIELDVRILATTNRNLREEVAAGRFREDLFYRLNVFPLHLPPLRDRPQDIVPMANFLLQRLCQSQDIQVPRLSEQAEQTLMSNRWSGNVRELDNVMQRALILCNGEQITPDELCFEMDSGYQPVPASRDQNITQESVAPGGLNGDLRSMEERMILDALREQQSSRKQVAERLGISQRTLRYKIARMRDAGVAIPG